MKARLAIALYAAAYVGGCATYAPLPLTDDAVERALRLPSRDELRARVDAMNNPLIRIADFDPEGPLTPDGAAVLAVVSNPTLRAQRARAGIADARLVQAGILPNPSLNFGLDAPFGPKSGGEATGYGLGIDWEITALVSRGAKVKAASAAGDQVRLDVAWNEWQVAQAARLATYAVIALREQRADARRLHDQLAGVADRLDRALAGHDATAADASAARAAEQEAAVSLAGIVRDLRDGELALDRAVGRPASTPLALADAVPLPPSLAVADAAALTTHLEARRIDLVALRRGYDSQESTLRAAVLGQFPKIALGISNTRDFGDFLTLGPTITADLPFFDRNQGNIAIERASRQQLFDEYVVRVFEARSDIARAVAMIRSLNELIAAQAAQVRYLRNLVDAADKALATGNIDVATFYTAAVDLSQKQAALTALKLDLIRAFIDLELASGARLDGALAIPTTRPEAL